MKKLLLILGTITATVVPVISCVACFEEPKDVDIYIDTSNSKVENQKIIDEEFAKADKDNMGSVKFHIRFKNGITRELGVFRMGAILNAQNYDTQSSTARIAENLLLGATSWTLTEGEIKQIIDSVPPLPADTFE